MVVSNWSESGLEAKNPTLEKLAVTAESFPVRGIVWALVFVCVVSSAMGCQSTSSGATRQDESLTDREPEEPVREWRWKSWEFPVPSEGRMLAARAVLDDGRVAVTAGTTDEPAPLTSALLFAPERGGWRELSDLNVDRFDHAAVGFEDGRVMVVGGTASHGSIRSSAEIYDPESREWELSQAPELGDHPPYVQLPDGDWLFVGKRVYGGDSGVRHRCHRFDPKENRWKGAADLGVSTTWPALARTPEGALLVVGKRSSAGRSGGADSRATKEIRLYREDDDQWTEGPAMNVARRRPVAGALPSGAILVTGTRSRSEPAEVYVPSSEEWNEIEAPREATPWEPLRSELPGGPVLSIDAGRYVVWDAEEGWLELPVVPNVGSSDWHVRTGPNSVLVGGSKPPKGGERVPSFQLVSEPVRQGGVGAVSRAVGNAVRRASGLQMKIGLRRMRFKLGASHAKSVADEVLKEIGESSLAGEWKRAAEDSDSPPETAVETVENDTHFPLKRFSETLETRVEKRLSEEYGVEFVGPDQRRSDTREAFADGSPEEKAPDDTTTEENVRKVGERATYRLSWKIGRADEAGELDDEVVYTVTLRVRKPSQERTVFETSVEVPRTLGAPM